MENLFTLLNEMLYRNEVLALAAALLWGVASILLSPCHLSSIPLVVGVITGKRQLNSRSAFRLSLVFALGILAALLVIGVITGLLGRMMGDMGARVNLVFGVALIIGGILLTDLVTLGSIPVLQRVGRLGDSLGGVFLIGTLFGIALGPCAFAFMAPVLGLALPLIATRAGYALMLFAAFAVGHCLVIVFAGTSMGWVRQLLSWNEKSRGLNITKKICGILVIAAGVYLFTKGLH
jgi:cytochrome c-type biogenesis protein